MRLLDLQELDRAIDELEASKSSYPTEVNLLKHEIETASRGLTKLQEEIHELEKRRRHFEGELELANAELQKHQQQLYQIRTNREYDALQIEIEECKRRISDTENEILQAMTAYDEFTKRIEEDKQAFAEMKEGKISRINELTQQLNSIEDRMKGRRQKREEMAGEISKGVLGAYERIRKAKKTTVVSVARGACGGCYKQIPPQKLIEIRKNAKLVFCENCGRILVWENRSV